MLPADVVAQVSPQGLVSPCKLAYVPSVFHDERLRPGVERKASAGWQMVEEPSASRVPALELFLPSSSPDWDGSLV
jgi:hypothetical protein